MKEKLIIANCSGFYGDRLAAAQEVVTGGEIHVLTGDYLAELTMALLFRMKQKSPDKGYVLTFMKQMEAVMGTCLDKGIKIVSNAGGLDPKGLAADLEKLASKLGLKPVIAYIEGDDLMPVMSELGKNGERFLHLDKGIGLTDAGAMPITANAYLGGWGITKALGEGADIVVGGRIADAALVSGPAAWKFGWKPDDWDKLAGAYTAGHIIECGAQATGGNYSFMEEVPSFENMGYPLAEVHEDGSFVITKHPGTGGLVSVGTVTAQLLYETREPAYLTPDVIARFDTLHITQQDKDRVLVTNAKGEPPTGNAKVCINEFGGYRNTMTAILTGLDIEKKAKLVEDAIFRIIGGKSQFRVCDVSLVRSDKEDPGSNEDAFAYLRISVTDPDETKVGKLFSSAFVEIALANIPGYTLTGPPSNGSPAIRHWPALMSGKNVHQCVHVNGKSFFVDFAEPDKAYPSPEPAVVGLPPVPSGAKKKIPLGRLFATRSGDKGGNANLGIWAKTPEAFSWLRENLTVGKLRELLPDMIPYQMERYELPNLLALNFYIIGVLGDGAAASMRSDPQAKTLGEYLRAKMTDVPEALSE